MSYQLFSVTKEVYAKQKNNYTYYKKKNTYRE